MASEYLLTTVTQVTPKLRIGYRVSVGGRCLAQRSGPGLIGIELRRGDGGDPETYPIAVDSRLYGPLPAGVETLVTLAAIDMLAPGSDPRRYQLRIYAVGAADDVLVRDANVATSPYSVPGLTPP